MTVQRQLESGVSLHQAGRVREAEGVYRQILLSHPNHAGTMILLGSLCVQTGRVDAGIELLRRSIRVEPRYADGHYNLGIALLAKGQLDEAIGALLQAIRLRPGSADFHNDLGTALMGKGKLDEAIAAFREAVRLKPEFAEGHYNLGLCLQATGQAGEAVAEFRRAIGLKPEFVQAHVDLGNALVAMANVDEAIGSYRIAIAENEGFADAHYNLGIALQGSGLIDDAVAAHRRAVELRPDWAEGYNNLGHALKARGEIAEAIGAYRRAVELKPSFAEAHSNLVFTLSYHPEVDGAMIREELRGWNERHAEPLKGCIQAHLNDRDADRRIRVGYVSPDFCQHVVGRNLVPLFKNHDPATVEIFCYANVTRADGLTEEFRKYAHVWRDIARLTDGQAAEVIREDRIDILVDLVLHTAGNRLGIFAREPAPVQVTFAGYPGSTGVETIDYRLTDPYLDPPGVNDGFYSEKSVRLRDSFWCYDPLVAEVDVGALPALSRGCVTFGCLNNFWKVNEGVVRLWGKVLGRVADSRLLVLVPEGRAREGVLNVLSGEGIDAQRVEFVGKRSRLDYLQTYRRIDIGLDTFPYNGHSTSLDSFWMGVPVITLVGRTVVGRAGVSQLTNLGLGELIAETAEEYVGIAARLAGDLRRLAGIRGNLRGSMGRSRLMDGKGFAESVEAAYRELWGEWCGKGSKG
jgi:protein O-GlcNAc transferase